MNKREGDNEAATKMHPVLGRLVASSCIIVVSAIVMYTACLRSSTIYFFELDSRAVLFVSKRHAFVFPLVLSALLAVVYMATRRSRQLEKQRQAERQRKEKEPPYSTTASRKVSRCADLRPIFEIPPPGYDTEGAARLRRMLSDIEENQSAQDVLVEDVPFSEQDKEKREAEEEKEPESEPGNEVHEGKVIHPPAGEDSLAAGTSLRSSSEPPASASSDTLFDDDPEGEESRPESAAAKMTLPLAQGLDDSAQRSRSNSLGSKTGLLHLSRRNSVSTPDEQPKACELYKDLGQIDFMTYVINAVNIFPTNSDGPGTVKRNIHLSDVLADLIAVHVPVWACVVALHVVLLELINVKFAFYFYYHEETMAYAALLGSIVFGLVHEFSGGWLSNDVLALASIYVVISRIQLVSYQTGVVLAVGLIAFDLFWCYVIDLLSTVTGHSRAPLMLVVPRDNEGGKQSLATLDIMGPGVLLNVLLKFNAMYDPKLFGASFNAAVAGLAATMCIAIYRKKLTPALVLPLIAVVTTSLAIVDRPYDLWRFAIKH